MPDLYRTTYSSRLPSLRADLLLLHAPASFDFRRQRNIYYPYLGTSGDVPITPLYEYFPLGFKTLERYLGACDHEVKLLNLGSLLLRYPCLDLRDVFAALDVGMMGIDLHWMVHVQGALEIARLWKEERAEVPVILGGISSTYYASELIRYPFVDFVMRGYDTHMPMDKLLHCRKQGGDLASVPNLVWKEPDGTVVDNSMRAGMWHVPSDFACGIDWSRQPACSTHGTMPIFEILSTQNAGCTHSCGWCGGSREAYLRLYGSEARLARKTLDALRFELASMRGIPARNRYHFYSVGSYNETPERLDFLLDSVGELGLGSVSYEQYHLTPDDVLKRMARANRRTCITLSPESSNLRVATLAGRGVYTMDEMEAWIERALGYGIAQIAVWFFVGMPEQGPDEVKQDVAYCGHLLRKFSGKQVTPYLCPMIPFLDPGSTFFCHPEEHGYRVFYQSIEQHRRGMLRASIIGRTNYETRWLSRRDLIRVGFRAVADLMQLRAESRQIPRSLVQGIQSRIDDALRFTDEVDRVDQLRNAVERSAALAGLGDEIERRNQEVFFSGVANQAYPIAREIGGRWFDELGWDAATLDGLAGGTLPVATARP